MNITRAAETRSQAVSPVSNRRRLAFSLHWADGGNAPQSTFAPPRRCQNEARLDGRTSGMPRCAMLERPSLRARPTQPGGGLTRRDLLVRTAVGLGSLVVVPSLVRPAQAERLSLQRAVRDLMAAGKLPGLGAAIVRDGEVAWSGSWGWADVEPSSARNPDTLFMLASVSKTVVATAVMQAVEDGLFDLDADVNGVLPFTVRNRVHPNRPITVRQLLTHTSEHPRQLDLLIRVLRAGDATMSSARSFEGYLAPNGADYGREQLLPVPARGESYRYANMGVSLAAYLVEAASGIGFDSGRGPHLRTARDAGRDGASPGLPRGDRSRTRTRWASGSTRTCRTGSTAIPTIPTARCERRHPSSLGISRW